MDASVYPGESTGPLDILRLASEYHAAAVLLHERRRKGEPISLAPCRFVAVHAIELYLNALLLMNGADPKALRGPQHDLAERIERAKATGVVFRQGTLSHLKDRSSREHLVARHDPELLTTLPQLNRLMATLNDVATKVRAAAVNTKLL